MDNLLRFILSIKDWLLFVILEAASIALIVGHNSYQSSVWFSTANAVTGKCYEWSSAVESFFSLTGINTQLTERNIQLELQLAQARKQIAALESNPEGIRENIPAGFRYVEAKVVQNTLDQENNLMTIDKGTQDGVRKDMGVVSGMGVVGIVYLAGAHYSVVIPIVNVESSISCRIRGRGYFGYLKWENRNTTYAYLEGVPRHAHYAKGDVVETSGYSSVFPAGINVGKVVCTFNSADGLSYRVKVKLSTDFGNLRDVCVIDNSPMEEQLRILQAAKDSIKSGKEE